VKLKEEATQQQRMHDTKPTAFRIESGQICTFLQNVQN